MSIELTKCTQHGRQLFLSEASGMLVATKNKEFLMGHNPVDVRVEAGPQLRTAYDVMQHALDMWRNDYDYDHGSLDYEYAKMTALVTPGGRFAVQHDGPCALGLVVPVAKAEDVKKITKKVTIQVPGTLANRLRGPRDWDAIRELHKIVQDEYSKDMTKVVIDKFPARRKAVATATDGKAVTVYNVVSVSASQWLNDKVLSKNHASMAEARKKALELADDPKYDEYDSFTIQGVVKRDSTDSALVTITRPAAEKVTLGLTVTTETLKPNARVDFYDTTFYIHS